MVAYKPRNHSGVSIHAGAHYYDNNPCTLQILHKYGAVCGGVSKFGTGRSANIQPVVDRVAVALENPEIL